VTSNELEGLTKEEFAKVAEEGNIFARLTPLQKASIVKSLQSSKHVVGFLGDGINDAAAIRTADVGISVDTAVDVAREAADIILLEKSLMVLVKGIMVGRHSFANTLKYIMMAVSSNFGNVFSMLIASSWLPFLPMLPVHIVVQNLLYDLSQLAIPWDNTDPEQTAMPKQWSIRNIYRFMVFIGPVSSIFDITTFLTMWFYYGIQTPNDNPIEFQTAWFVLGLTTQSAIVHMIRTAKVPFVQSHASLPVIVGTVIVIVIGCALPYSPLNHALSMVPLPASYFGFWGLFVVSYCVLSNLVKFWYIRKYHEWI